MIFRIDPFPARRMGNFTSGEKCPLCARPLGVNPLIRFVRTPEDQTIACHASCADAEETQDPAGPESCQDGKIPVVEMEGSDG